VMLLMLFVALTEQAISEKTTSSVDRSRDNSAAGASTSAATTDVTSGDVTTHHHLLADQPEVVRQLVDAMMAKWNARSSDVTSAPTYDDGAAQLNVLEVDGDLASSVMPQV